ncbi:MAG: hypothetical protein QXK88_08190 [Desulfurococcaceae archaeon]
MKNVCFLMMRAKSLRLAPLVLIAALLLISLLALAWIYPPYPLSKEWHQLGVEGTTLHLPANKWIAYVIEVTPGEKVIVELKNYIGKAEVCIYDPGIRSHICKGPQGAPLKHEYTIPSDCPSSTSSIAVRSDTETSALLTWYKQTCDPTGCFYKAEGERRDKPMPVTRYRFRGGIEAGFIRLSAHYYLYRPDRNPIWGGYYSFIVSLNGSRGSDINVRVYNSSGNLVKEIVGTEYPDYGYVKATTDTYLLEVFLTKKGDLNEYNLRIERPTIEAYSLSETLLKPGQEFTISYKIYNPFYHIVFVFLEAHIKTVISGREYVFRLPSPDTWYALRPGVNVYTKKVAIPMDAIPSSYTLILSLWGYASPDFSSVDVCYDAQEYNNALTVQVPSNPEITYTAANPDKLLPGASTTVTVKWIFYRSCPEGCVVKANAFGSWAKTTQLAVIYDGLDGNYGNEQSRSFTVQLPSDIPIGTHYIRVGFCFDNFAKSYDELAKCTYRDIPITVQVPRYSFRVVVRGGDNRIYHRVCTGAACESWSIISALAIDTPGAVLLSNQLYLVIRAPDDCILFGSFDLQTGSFSGWERIGGSTPSRPALATDGSKLYLVVRGRDNRIYLRVYTISTRTWSSWTVLPGSTIDAPAAAVHGGRLHIVVRGGDGMSIYHGQYDLSSGQWLGWVRISGSTLSAPTLTSDGTRLWLTVRGGDNRIYIRTWSGSWGSWERIPTGSTDASPAIKVIGSYLVVVVKANGGTSIYYCFKDLTTNSWSSWTRMSGSTPSSPTTP